MPIVLDLLDAAEGDETAAGLVDVVRSVVMSVAGYEGSVGGVWFNASLSAPCSIQDPSYGCRVLSTMSLEIWTDRS